MAVKLAGSVAALCILFLQGCSSDKAGSSDLRPTTATSVKTSYGVVIGVDNSSVDGTYAWKGVPYAKAPQGALRWAAPVDPDPWATPISAIKFGNACEQTGTVFGPGSNNAFDLTIGSTLGQALGSEDCLYLNIWRPSGGSGNLPVIVFIHGGSNTSGYTAEPTFDGAQLAKTAGAAVVTVNYRLGVFGFLELPQLHSGSVGGDSGNFALLDQIKALQFLQTNISEFGGNPANVTLMGQSAGADDVFALMTSPSVIASKPQLFHRAMPLSGGLSLSQDLPAGNIPTLSPASIAILQGATLLEKALIRDRLATDSQSAKIYLATQTSTQIATYLRSKSPDVLLDIVAKELTLQGLSSFGPIPEGTVVPVDPVAAIKSGTYLKIPVLAGNTGNELKLLPSLLASSPALGGVDGRVVSDETMFSTQFSYVADATPTIDINHWIAPAYLPVTTPVTGFDARINLLDNVLLYANNENILDAMKSQQPNVWAYRFNWAQEPSPWNAIYGAAHGFDLPFIFGNFGHSLFGNISNTVVNQQGRLSLSALMIKSVAAFATAGDPNQPSLGTPWPVWPSRLNFDATNSAPVISVQ